MTMTTVTIHELTEERRTWTSRHRTADKHAAIRRALTRSFGADYGFWQDLSMQVGWYGSIIRSEPNTGSGWRASVVIGRVRIDVEGQ